jgi:hypothetical protein
LKHYRALGVVSSYRAEPGVHRYYREPVGEFPVFQTFLEAATAVTDDEFHVVRRDVAASYVTVVIVKAVERADGIFGHKTSNPSYIHFGKI